MIIDPDDLDEISTPQPGDPSRHFLIYCDESGIDGGTVFGFGSLWMPWERRGDFQQIWRRLHEDHFPPSEVKWTKVKSKTLPFFEALVDEFFTRNWLMFHCLLIGKPQVDLSYHKDNWDLARRKHFVMLLSNKIKRFAAPGKCYRIRVDPIASSYKKADEAAGIILQRIIDEVPKLKGSNVIHSLRTVDSKATPGVQLSDVLLGAVVSARRGKATSEEKRRLTNRIAEHLGWPDLHADTLPDVRKFNIWRFWDPTSGEARPEITRRRTSTW
jgi:hypothetical protein